MSRDPVSLRFFAPPTPSYDMVIHLYAFFRLLISPGDDYAPQLMRFPTLLLRYPHNAMPQFFLRCSEQLTWFHIFDDILTLELHGC